MRTHVDDFFTGIRFFLLFSLLAMLFSPLTRSQTALSISPALSALIQQADQTYARSDNQSIQYFFDKIPLNAAIIMGLAMHGQKRIADQDPRYRSQYEALRQEAHEFLGGLAKVHNFINPYDGQPMDPQFLAMVFDSNALGEQNQWAVQKGLPNPALVQQPLILNMVAPESRGRFFANENPNEIRLLDQVAPPVQVPERYTQPSPPPVSQPEPQRQPISQGAILGSWQKVSRDCAWFSENSTRLNNYISFSPGGGRDLYVGRSDADTFRIRSENQVDPFTIKYTAVWENPNGQMLYLVHGKEFTITVYRGKRNGMLLCRGGAGGVMASGYLKVGN